MDRRRLVGVLLVVVSAASFGSGALFAKPVYAEGVGWLTLLCWRFAGHTATLATVLRWAALAALVVYGCLRRTLTAWIFIAMLLGARKKLDIKVEETRSIPMSVIDAITERWDPQAC